MKLVALFLAAVSGGLVGSVALYLALGSQVVCPRVDEVAMLRCELNELRNRLGALETRGDPAPEISGESPAIAREDLLEAARTAAREEAWGIVQGESTAGESMPVRQTALIRALEQLEAPHEDTRENGIRRLRRMFAAEASARVVPALADESARVRKEAATYFEYLWDPAALEPLVELMYGEDESIAEQALDALCKSGEEEAIALIQEYYLTGPALELAYEAGKALEENHRIAAVPSGLQRFRDALGSTDPADRQIGIAGIRRWGTVAADAWRVRAMTADTEERVRTEAHKTLAAWGIESNN